MANGFSITINAVNNASGVLEKINKSLTALQKPGKDFSTQVKKFGELTGLAKVRQGFDGIVRSSLGAARSVARVAEPLAAITGAASIGGFTMLLSRWAEFNTTLGFSAERMGVMPQMLGNLRAAGSLAGGSADAMQTGFDNLDQTLYDVANGQAPQAAYIMSRLGISLTDATGHARRAKDVMPQLADAIARVHDPLAQARLATMLFGSAGVDMLPVLRQGSAGMERLRLLAQRYGGTTDQGTAAALQFSQAQAAVGQSVVGLTDAIATQLAPVISPLLLQLADWISKGRTSVFVTSGLGEGIKDFAGWIKTVDFAAIIKDVKDFGGEVVRILGYLDDWRNKLEQLKAPQEAVRNEHPTMLGRWLYDHSDRLRQPDNLFYGSLDGAPAAPAPASGTGAKQAGADQARQFQQAAHAMALLEKLGWSEPRAAGMAANMLKESAFDPRKEGDFINGVYQAYGVGQWHPDRQQHFADWAGFSIRDPRATLDKQIEFYSYERLHGSEQKAGRAILGTQTAYDAGATDSLMGERPGGGEGEAALRGRTANLLYNLSASGEAASLSPNAGMGAAGATGRVDMTITTPPAHKVTARATGNVNPPKIKTAMDTSGASVGVGGLY